MWENMTTHSIIFEGDSKLLLESPPKRERNQANAVGSADKDIPQELLKELKLSLHEYDLEFENKREDEIKFLID